MSLDYLNPIELNGDLDVYKIWLSLLISQTWISKLLETFYVELWLSSNQIKDDYRVCTKRLIWKRGDVASTKRGWKKYKRLKASASWKSITIHPF